MLTPVLVGLYVLKNISGSNRSISSYRTLSNVPSNTIPTNSAIWIQSDGIDWHRIN